MLGRTNCRQCCYVLNDRPMFTATKLNIRLRGKERASPGPGRVIIRLVIRWLVRRGLMIGVTNVTLVIW